MCNIKNKMLPNCCNKYFTQFFSEQDISRSPELILKEITDNLAKYFPSNFLNIVKHTDLSSLAWAPLRFRVPWNVAIGKAQNGNVTVAGDAMHPMTPDLGQGACSALEDAVVLVRCLSQAHTTAAEDKQWVEKGLKRYKLL
jgi:2-polyprenyl-6-methoxyphenol hydroxylase-like FAD-dependent oxidoreductase